MLASDRKRDGERAITQYSCDTLCFCIRELACDHTLPRDGAVDSGRLDDFPVERNCQDIPYILSSEVAKTSGSITFHREIDLRTSRLFLDTDADLPRVQVFSCKLSLTIRIILCELLGVELRAR